MQPFARLLLGSKAKKSAIEKYAQSAMEFIFYGAYTLIGLGVVPNQPWIWPSANWWNVYGKEPTMSHCSGAARVNRATVLGGS